MIDLGLTDSDTDKLGSHVGEQGEDKSVDESEEFTEVAGPLVRLEGPSILPVPETDSLLTRNTSEVDDQTEEDETGKGDDLDEGQPELDLSKPLDTETVDCDNLRRQLATNGHDDRGTRTKAMKMVTQAAPLIDWFQYRMTRLPATIWLGLMIKYWAVSA